MTLTISYQDKYSPNEIVQTTEAKFYAYDGCHKIYMVEDESDFMEAIETGYNVKRIEDLRNDWKNSCPLKFIHNWKLNKDYIPQFAKKVKIRGQAKFRYPTFTEVIDLKVEDIETDLISRIMFINEDKEYSYVFILTENEIFKDNIEDITVLAYGRVETKSLKNFNLKEFLDLFYINMEQYGNYISLYRYDQDEKGEGVHKLFEDLITNETLLEDVSKAVSDRYITCVEQIYGEL